jgi:hypothetical protein
MKKALTFTLLFTVMSTAWIACKKDASDDPDTEIGRLYAEVNDNNFVYYKGEDKVLSPKGSSPHGDFKLRFNNIALAALDSTGKLPLGASFPDGSIVLKEIIKDGKVDAYYPMKKGQNNGNAAKGWLWYAFEKGGKEKIKLSDKGKDCVSCHSAGGNRDYTFSFDLH